VGARAKQPERIQDRNNSMWLAPGDIDIEIEQCADEGKRLGILAAQGEELKKRLDTAEGQQVARKWLEKTLARKERGPHAGQEPSDLKGIRDLRPRAPRTPDADFAPARMVDRIHGAWLGRCCGCYLGKPVEGVRRADMHAVLKHQDRFPLNGYWRPGVPKAVERKGGRWPTFPRTWGLKYMPEDDDTNYTAIGLAVVKKCGPDFTPTDVAEFWLRNVPFLHCCTAERVAYRNFTWGINPPESAVVANPYREWIGAQIRADAFGYLAVGRPALAAEFAWRDASISHVKNGIYGEMWVAAMLAWAYVLDDPRDVVLAGLNEIPAGCRLADAVRHVVDLFDEGARADEAVTNIHTRWDETNRHHWVHTISNAEIVTYALLWGKRRFGRTVCLAVDAAFDTDCNGATAGSVLGMMLGATALPASWTRQLNDTLETGVAGYHRVSIAGIAKETADLARTLVGA